MPLRRNRRTRVKASAERIDVLDALLGGAHCWTVEENAQIESELAKVPLVLERWRRDRKICLLPDDQLIKVSEGEDASAAQVAKVEIRIRVRHLKEQEMQPTHLQNRVATTTGNQIKEKHQNATYRIDVRSDHGQPHH